MSGSTSSGGIETNGLGSSGIISARVAMIDVLSSMKDIELIRLRAALDVELTGC